MSTQTTSDDLTLSRWMVGSFIFIIFGCFLFAIFPAILWITGRAPHTYNSPPDPVPVALAGLIFGVLMPGVLLLVFYFSGLGTWRFTSEGVEFRHFLDRRPVFVPWEEVDQVLWTRVQFGFRAKGRRRLVATWEWFPKNARPAAKARLEALLAANFDMTLPPRAPIWSFEPNSRSATLWALKVAAISIGFAGLFVGLSIAAVLYRDTAFGRVLPLATLVLFLLSVFAAFFMQARSEKALRANRPVLPDWRLRRVSGAARIAPRIGR
jgi:hypothetical protein